MNFILTEIVLVGAALGVLIRFVFTPLWRSGRALVRGVTFVQHELSENSGRSIRDITYRTDLRFELLFDHLGIEMPDHLRTPAPKSEQDRHAS